MEMKEDMKEEEEEVNIIEGTIIKKRNPRQTQNLNATLNNEHKSQELTMNIPNQNHNIKHNLEI